MGNLSPTLLLLINGYEDQQVPRSSALLLAQHAIDPVRQLWLHRGSLSSRDHELLRELADSTLIHFGFGSRRAADALW